MLVIPAMKPFDLNPSKSGQVHGANLTPFLILRLACLFPTNCDYGVCLFVPDAMARLGLTFLSLFISVGIHRLYSNHHVTTTNTT